MQVITYKAHNVLGVKDIKFDLAGRHLFLVGGANGQGKSSALTALIMALSGKSGMSDYPEIALRKGEKKGKVTIDLAGDTDESKITVELSVRQKTGGFVVEEFRVLDSEGKKVTEPRKLLQRLFTLRAFDPLEFERMPPKEKATLVQKMLGLDLSTFDNEYNRVFEDRTVLGRDGKKLAAQFEAAPKHVDAPTEDVKVVDLMADMEKLQEENKSKAAMQKLADEASHYHAELTKQCDGLTAKIAELQKQLVETTNSMGAAKKAAEEARSKAEKMTDRAPDIAAVKDKISKADETNRKVRENAARDSIEKELNKFRGDYQKLTDRLTEIQEKRAEAVANAKWPVEGMELNEDGLLMDGLPFEQASTSQRIMASVKVGMALNPKLRLLVCQHGSDLDNATLDALDEVVRTSDFQCLVEIVTRSKEDEERCAVVIADGEVVGAKKSPDMEESSDTDEDSSEEK